MEWNKAYNIGVDEIDKAHRQLFSIIHKMVDLLEDEDNAEYACQQGIRFFKSYTLKHFVEEEAYMASIGYPDLERHRALHEAMRVETLPALERELEATDYAHSTVQKVVGVFLGWLTSHVANEDQAITGNAQLQLSALKNGEILAAMESIISQIVRNTFGLESMLVNDIYTGWNRGEALFHELMYTARDGKKVRVVFVLEENLILSTTGQMLSLRFARVDETVLAAVRAISQNFLHRIGELMGRTGQYEMTADRLLTEEEFHTLFDRSAPRYSMLFFTKNGHYACYFDEVKG